MSEYPVVREIKHRLLEMGAVFFCDERQRLYGIWCFPSRETAEKAAQSMKPVFCRVVETIV